MAFFSWSTRSSGWVDRLKKIVGWALVLAITAQLTLVFIGEEYGFSFAPYRLVDTRTRLGIFDTRIGDVVSEFMRRSPDLRESFGRFSDCMKRENAHPESCDMQLILMQRDRIIKDMWPDMLDRLSRADDWGGRTYSRSARDEFLAEIKRHGFVEAREQCQPKIMFMSSVRGYVWETYVKYDGLECGR